MRRFTNDVEYSNFGVNIAMTNQCTALERQHRSLFIYYKKSISPFALPNLLSQQIRHVILPKELAKTLPKTRLLSENEWRSIGVQQSRGWQHYAIHRPEPHILLFRRPLGTDPQTGAIDPELKRMALEEYKGQFGLRGH